jgi:hypothetical protein
MAGMDVVAIEREPLMIQAIKHRVTVIQALLSNVNFDYQQWYQDLAKEEYSDGRGWGRQGGGGGGGQVQRTSLTYLHAKDIRQTCTACLLYRICPLVAADAADECACTLGIFD